jgi:hypothetical protein
MKFARFRIGTQLWLYILTFPCNNAMPVKADFKNKEISDTAKLILRGGFGFWRFFNFFEEQVDCFK